MLTSALLLLFAQTPVEHSSSPLSVPVLADLIERFGLSVGMLVIGLWSLMKTAKFIAPRIDRLVTRHEELLDTVQSEMRNHGQVLREKAVILHEIEATQGRLLANIETTQGQMLECLRAVRGAIDRIVAERH